MEDAGVPIEAESPAGVIVDFVVAVVVVVVFVESSESVFL